MKKKKILILVALICSTFLAKGQQWTEGAGKLTTTKRIGIGTTTPANQFHVKFPDNSLGFSQGILIQSNSGSFSAGRGGGIIMQNANVKTAGIFGIREKNNWEGALSFYTHNDISENLFNTSFTEKMRLTSKGYLGLGTINPSAKIDVLNEAKNGSEVLMRMKVSDANNDYFSISNGTGNNGHFVPLIKGHHGSDNRHVMHLSASTTTSLDYGNNPLYIFDARLIDGANHGTVGNRPIFEWRNFSNTKMIMLANGNVGIGTKTTGSYKLAVNGTIGGKELVLENESWPDYVFRNDYELQSLEEVEQFINENQHLPAVPSEEEVSENGINVSEMNAVLLKKIEELTLHMIEMNKRVNELEIENEKLKK